MSYSRGPSEDPYWYPSPPATWEVRSGSPPLEGKAPGVKMASAPTVGEERARAYPVLLGIFFAVFLAYLLYLQTRSDIGDNGTLRGISDLFVLFGSAVCAIACGMTALTLRRMHVAAATVMARRAWIAWAFLGGAALAYTVGQAIWTWYDANYTSANLPFPATYDPFYLTVYPLSWVGIALLIPRAGSAAGRTRLLLDAGIAVASALAISWYFILGPTVTSLSGSTIEKTVALAYPLGDLSLCAAAALVVFGTSSVAALNGSLARLGIGVTWLALTDSLYGFAQLQGTYHTGLIQDIGWPMSWLFVGWAALAYPTGLARLTGLRLDDQRSSTAATRLGTTGAALRATTPMVLAVVTCALLLVEVDLRKTAPLTQIVLVCAGLLLLPLIRQALTLIDNLILNDRLRVALDQSQRAFMQSQQELAETSTRAERYDELRAGIQDLQAVHAVLARGDLNARARVEGPLAPVAQSLNLFIERLNRWAQFVQANRVLEAEANALREELERMSAGRLAPLPAERSGLATGGALVAASHLQRQLALHFDRMRRTIDLFGRQWGTLAQHIRLARQGLEFVNESAPAESTARAVQEALAQTDGALVNGQTLLQELWTQASLYAQPPDPMGPQRSPDDFSFLSRP